jgi:hypothetical protein
MVKRSLASRESVQVVCCVCGAGIRLVMCLCKLANGSRHDYIRIVECRTNGEGRTGFKDKQ